jgi:hypothetical protein
VGDKNKGADKTIVNRYASIITSMYLKHLFKLLLSLAPAAAAGQDANKTWQESIVDLYNYHTVRFALVSGTKYESDFDAAYRNYASKYGISGITFDRIKSSIPATLPKTKKICAEIESIKTSFLPVTDIAVLPQYLVETAYKETDYSGSPKYPELDAMYRKKMAADEQSFSLFKTTLTKTLKQAVKTEASAGNGTPYSSKKKTSTMADWITEHITLVVAGIIFLIWLSYIISSGKAETKIIVAQNKMKEIVNAEIKKYELQAVSRKAIDKNQEVLNKLNEERLQKLEDATFGGVWAAYLELKEQTGQLLQKVKRLEAKAAGGKADFVSTSTATQQKTASPESDATGRQLFFPVPDKKTGQFRSVLGKDSIAGYSVYQFVIDAKDENRASFSLIKTEKVQTAVLNFPEAYLLHACEAEGVPGISKKIEPLVQGIARHEGDYWIIEQKAKIRYV